MSAILPSQIIINGIVSAATITLLAIGFALIFSTTKFFHFAHGIIFTAAPYFAYWLRQLFGGINLIIFPFAVFLSILLGAIMYFIIYQPLKARKASPVILLLASLGIYIALQNTISLLFGDDGKSIMNSEVKEGISIIGAKITQIQLFMVVFSLLLTFLMYLIYKKTKLGMIIRAVSNDPELAEISGINSNKVIFFMFVIGSAFAGIAGVLFSLDLGMVPTMGLQPLMVGVVAVIVGGTGSIPGILIASNFLGFLQEFSTWHLKSNWKDTVVFLVLIVFLLVRPKGIFGKKIMKVEI